MQAMLTNEVNDVHSGIRRIHEMTKGEEKSKNK
jgi:hypothetical protein